MAGLRTLILQLTNQINVPSLLDMRWNSVGSSEGEVYKFAMEHSDHGIEQGVEKHKS